ncbi:MAG: hypothetical protein MZV63_56305 [Marinilabiliales bacterium]|nr:hypothetical protein [Marinilabiliales bacterium]
MSTYSGAGKEDIQYIGSDIRFIDTKPFTLRAAGLHVLRLRGFPAVPGGSVAPLCRPCGFSGGKSWQNGATPLR